MRFEYPVALVALAGLPILAGVALWERRQLKRALVRWSQVLSVSRANRLPGLWVAVLEFALLAAGLTCAVLGFASPVIRRAVQEPLWDNVVIGLLIDVSRSTTAPLDPRAVDSPSRWDEMQRGLLEFLRQSPPGLRITALAFTDLAVPLMALPTDDHLEVAAKLRRLDHRFISRQGTNLVEAVRAGVKLLVAVPNDKRDKVFSLVLISDGDTGYTPELDAELARVSFPIHAIGVGGIEPVFIPDPGSPTGYLEELGEPVQTVLREDTLAAVAKRTGGQYFPFTKRGELFKLLGVITRQQGLRTTRTMVHEFRVGVVFLLAAFVLLAVHRQLTR